MSFFVPSKAPLKNEGRFFSDGRRVLFWPCYTSYYVLSGTWLRLSERRVDIQVGGIVVIVSVETMYVPAEKEQRTEELHHRCSPAASRGWKPSLSSWLTSHWPAVLCRSPVVASSVCFSLFPACKSSRPRTTRDLRRSSFARDDHDEEGRRTSDIGHRRDPRKTH